MELNEIICKETGKKLRADVVKKIVNSEHSDCIEEILSIRYICPYADSSREAKPVCKNCYGTIIQKKRRLKENRSGNHKVEIDTFRNSFNMDEVGEYIDNMDADDILNYIDKVINLNSLNWNHGQRIDDKLRGYDRPNSWKTDCQKCKQLCFKNNVKPKCELAKEYLEEKYSTSVDTMSEKQITSEIPAEFICQSQAQTMYYV